MNMEKSYLFLYYKSITKYTIRNLYYHLVLLLLDYFPVFSMTTLSLQSIIKLFKPQITFNSSFYQQVINIFSFSYINKDTNKIEMNKTFIVFPLLVYCLFSLLCIVVIRQSNPKKKPKFKLCHNKIKIILFTLFDTILFRTLNMYLSSPIIYYLFKVTHETSTSVEFILIILLTLFLGAHLSFILLYYYTFHTIIQLNSNNFKYPYDSFSFKFDSFLFMMKILTSFRLCLIEQKELKVFFDSIIIFLIFFSGFYSFFSIKTIIVNHNLNYIRLFFPLLNFIYLILYSLFGTVFNLPLIILVSLSLIPFVILVLHLLIKKHKANLIRNKERIDTILYLIDDLMNMKYNIIEYKKNNQSRRYLQFITKITISHEINCTLKQCDLCSFEYSKVFNDEESKVNFIKILLSTDTLRPYYKTNSELFDLVTLIQKVMFQTRQNFKNSYIYHKMISRYNKKNLNITLNILLHHHFQLKDQNEEIKKVISIQNIITVCSQIELLIKEYQELIFIREHSPVAFVSSALIIGKLKNVIKTNCLKKNDFDKNYHMIIICFILETLLNKKIKHNSGFDFDCSTYNELLNENYMYSKYVVLVHELNTKIYKIQNAGKELAIYTNQKIEKIILKEFQETFLVSFNNHLKLNCNKEPFEFPIKDIDNNTYIQSLFMKLLPLPSVDNKTLLINSIYRIDNEDLIIFTHDHNLETCYMSHYSKRLEKILLISTRRLYELNKNRRFLCFNSCFYLSNKEDTNDSVMYVLNLKRLYTELNNIFNYDKPFIEKIKCANNSKTLSYFVEKMAIKGEKLSYTIYSSWKAQLHTVALHEKENQFDEISNDNQDYFNNYCAVGTILTSMRSSTLTPSVTATSQTILSSQMRAFAFKGKDSRYNKEEDKKKNNSLFKKYTIMIFISDLFLVFISIIYLIIDINSTYDFQHKFQIESHILTLEIQYLHSNLNFFGTMCLDGPNNIECYDYFKKFNDIVLQNHKDDFDLRGYFFDELVAKAELIEAVIVSFKKVLYNFNNKKLIQLIEEIVTFISLTPNKNQLNIHHQEITFLEALQRYGNMLNLIIVDKHLMNEPIFLFDIINDTIIIENIYEEPYSSYQITIYEFTVNYLMYYKMFEKIKTESSVLLQSSIKYKELLSYFFPLFLLFIHLILFVICFLFIRKFELILELNIKEMMYKINDESTCAYYFQKINLVKQLSKFFVENPLKIIKKLEENLSKFKLSRKELNQSVAFNESKICFEKRDYRKVTNKDKGIFVMMFVIYFLYLTIYYFISMNMIEKYVNGNDYIINSSRITSSVFNTVGLLNIMLLTNRSDKTLNEILNNNSTIGLTEIKLSEVYLGLLKVLNLQSWSFVPLFNNLMNFQCSELFFNLKDVIIDNTVTSEEDYGYLSMICDYYKLMHYETEVTLIYEVGLELHNLVNQLEVNNRKKMYEVGHSIDYYSIMTLVLIVFRPIRSFYLVNFYPETVSNVTFSNTVISIIFLISHIIIEVIILLITKLIIINKLLKKNCSLLILNTSLR